jgi:hypothetical protein
MKCPSIIKDAGFRDNLLIQAKGNAAYLNNTPLERRTANRAAASQSRIDRLIRDADRSEFRQARSASRAAGKIMPIETTSSFPPLNTGAAKTNIFQPLPEAPYVSVNKPGVAVGVDDIVKNTAKGTSVAKATADAMHNVGYKTVAEDIKPSLFEKALPYLRKYKTPGIVAGSVLAAGGAAYALGRHNGQDKAAEMEKVAAGWGVTEKAIEARLSRINGLSGANARELYDKTNQQLGDMLETNFTGRAKGTMYGVLKRGLQKLKKLPRPVGN